MTSYKCEACGKSITRSSTTHPDIKRFAKRHPKKCEERRLFTKQLAEGVRSVEN